MVRVIDLDANLLRRVHENFWLDLDEVSPGPGLDGREQLIFSENRRWIGRLDLIHMKPEALRAAEVIGDQLRGRINHLRVTLFNPGLDGLRNDLTAFHRAIGVSSEDIARGYLLFSDGAEYDGGTGFALPDMVDPVTVSAATSGASSIQLDGVILAVLVPGSFFSVNDYLYRVEANDAGAVVFNPPLREDVAAGASVQVVFPTVRVRLADRADWRPFAEYFRHGQPMTVNVVEAFDR